MSWFVDTNVFLRFLLADHPEQSPKSLALFTAIERGERTVWTSDFVIGEIVFVLSSPHLYRLERERIRELVVPLLALPGLAVPGKAIFPRAFGLFVDQPIDFADAYHAALIESRGETHLYSFDRDFDWIPTLAREEPDESG